MTTTRVLGLPVFGSLAVLLVACSTPPSALPKPPLAIPERWSASDGSEMVQTDWWKAFGDQALERLISEALGRNTDLRLAAGRVAEARALAAEQHGSDWPSANVAAGASRSRALSPVNARAFEASTGQWQFQAAYEVDLWGRIGALGRAADADYLRSMHTRDAAELSVAASTASAYFALRALDARLQVARNTLASRESAVALARSRERSGYTSRLERAQAEAEYRSTAQVVPQLELAVARQEHALGVLLGRTSGRIERGKALDEIALPSIPALGIPSELLRRRPDIAASEAEIVASDARLAAARASLLPTLKLSGNLGRTSTIHGPLTLWSLGGSVLAPIFEGGRLRAQVQISEARRELALVGYETSVIAAVTEVENQLVLIDRIRGQMDQVDEQEKALAEAQRIASNRHREGYASYLDELDAQRALFGAEQTALQLRGDLLAAQVGLYRALGGGWHEAPPDVRVESPVMGKSADTRGSGS